MNQDKAVPTTSGEFRYTGYQVVPTDWSFETANGVETKPVATLADNAGGCVQIAVDDGCYILYVNTDDGYAPSHHWFHEAVRALRDLPDNPREA